MAEVTWSLLHVTKDKYQIGEMAQRENKDLREKLEQEKIRSWPPQHWPLTLPGTCIKETRKEKVQHATFYS